MKIKPVLKFRIPIFDIKLKIYVGDVEDIVEQQEVNIDLPYIAAQWVKGATINVAFPEDYDDTLLDHEMVHATFELFDMIGSPVNKCTEEFFAYIKTHLTHYVKENI